MSKLAGSLLIWALLCPSSLVLACSAATPISFRNAAESDAIWIGYVTADFRPGYEAILLAGGNPEPPPPLFRRVVRIVATEALKGAAQDVIELPTQCEDGFPAIRERAIVFRRGARDYVFPAVEQDIERLVREGLDAER